MPRSNMAFAVAYPEQLRQAVAPESADYVYLNSSFALFSDPPRVLRECWAVLVPGGSLLIECAVAESEGPSATRALLVQAAQRLGNAVQAAPSRTQLMGWLAEAGFMAPALREEHEVAADRGACSTIASPRCPATTRPTDSWPWRRASPASECAYEKGRPAQERPPTCAVCLSS